MTADAAWLRPVGLAFAVVAALLLAIAAPSIAVLRYPDPDDVLRLVQVREEARRSGGRLPGDDELRQQLLNALIDERVLITYARDAGQKIEDAELERAIANVAAQNQLTVPQLRERLRGEGIDYTRFRNNIRDQMMTKVYTTNDSIRNALAEAERLTQTLLDADLVKLKTQVK